MNLPTDTQLDTLRRLLDEREALLQQEVRAVGDADQADTGALATDVGDAVDIGQNRFQAGMAHVDKQRDQEELMAIDAARSRMVDGSYGECADCGKSIPVERLMAQPSALRCVPCQQRYEKTHPSGPLFTV